MRAPRQPTEADASALPPEVARKIRGIQLRAQRLVSDGMAGRYTSAFKGRGMQFEEVRAYQPGDDVRHIDWNQTARHGGAFVKEFRQERELTVMLVVDVSGSLAFGSGRRLKSEVTAEVAAVLAQLASNNQDRVGLTLFSDRVEATVPPRRGRAHVWRVVRDILTFRPAHRGTRVAAAWESLRREAPRGAICFVISDFLDPDVASGLGAAAARCDITAVVISDPAEAHLPRVGLVALEDAEDGGSGLVDTHDPALRRALTRAREAQAAALAQALGQRRIGRVDVDTALPYLPTLVRYLRARGRGRRAG